jgi:hypothetical protein
MTRIADDPHTLGGNVAVEDRMWIAGCGTRVTGSGSGHSEGVVSGKRWGIAGVEVVGCVFQAKDAEES